MPAFETRDLTQTALLWPFAGYDQYGEPQVGVVQVIKVRWTWTKGNSGDPKMDQQTEDAKVVAAVDIGIESRLWLGSLEDWDGVGDGPGSGGVPNDLCVVKTINYTPDLKGRNVRREYGLQRFRDSQ